MLRKFKSLFIIEEADTKAKGESTEAPSTKGQIKPTESRPSEAFAGVEAGDGQVQERFLEVLFNALEASNQEGFDYMEFKEFLRSLGNLQMDDATRYKSAYVTAQTMGATRNNILSSAKHYIEVLRREKAKFGEALDGQKAKNLTGKQEEIKQLEKDIQEKTARIEALQAGILSDREKIGTLEAEIESAAGKLSQTAQDFDATYQALLGQIEADIRNIETHLQ
jgi:chromosome segregation ATPase